MMEMRITIEACPAARASSLPSCRLLRGRGHRHPEQARFARKLPCRLEQRRRVVAIVEITEAGIAVAAEPLADGIADGFRIGDTAEIRDMSCIAVGRLAGRVVAAARGTHLHIRNAEQALQRTLP